MPRFFFHSADGRRQIDQDGTELPDLATARREAVKFSGQVLAHSPAHLWERGHWRVEVTDAHRRLLFTVVTVAVDAPALASHPAGGSVND